MNASARRKLTFLESRYFSPTQSQESDGAAYAQAFGLDWNQLLSDIQSEFTPTSFLTGRSDTKHADDPDGQRPAKP
jgi:hypothetical protein